MKKLIYFLLFALVFSNVAKSQDDLSTLESYAMSKIVVEIESLYSPVWESVLTGSFYEVVPTFQEDNGSTTCTSYIMRVYNGEVSEVFLPGSDEELPELLSMVNENFRLKSESDAKLFESALDAIFPLFSFDEEKKEHRIIDGKWYFVRGDFFEAKTAIIVTTNSEGKPVLINYMLKAIE